MSKLQPYLLLVLLLPVLWTQAQGQTLEELLRDREEEESAFRQTRGAEMPKTGEEPFTGRLRLPSGESIERLRLSQDRAIDPQTYLVGPGDVIQLYIWGEFDLSYLLQVDPEGNIIIPTVGAFAVSGLTLSQVKEWVHETAQQKYPGVELSISLASMRFFTVYATGAVLREGSFTVQPTNRVSDLIEKSGGYLDELRGATIEEEVAGRKVTRVRQVQPHPASRRAIQLHRSDGTREEVDLGMFYATGDLRFNPYVRMGDVVHVHYRQHEVYVYGAVNKEGEQEYRPGDTLGKLLTLAGGLEGEVPLEQVHLWRFLADGRQTAIIDLAELSPGPLSLESLADFPLQPQDMLFVRTRSDWQQTPTVHLYGEVAYRGRYRIVLGQTRLRDIIEQAGGLTSQASLAQATLIRVRARDSADPELLRLQGLQQVSGLADMTPEDRAYLKTKEREQQGRIGVDFERLFWADDQTQNILLEGGDVIFIPEKRNTVTVSGQVKTPGLIEFIEDRPVNYYLSRVGGFAWRADKGSARLIRARTGVREKLSRNLVVEPGDEIWIPEKEYRDWWQFTQSTMRTLAETLTILVLIRTL